MTGTEFGTVVRMGPSPEGLPLPFENVVVLGLEGNTAMSMNSKSVWIWKKISALVTRTLRKVQQKFTLVQGGKRAHGPSCNCKFLGCEQERTSSVVAGKSESHGRGTTKCHNKDEAGFGRKAREVRERSDFWRAA